MTLTDSKNVQPNYEIPNISGIFILSHEEIKNDLQEIGKIIGHIDIDSDSSVKSEEVLSSSYPVKPRKTPKNINAKSYSKEYTRTEYNSKAAEDLIAYIKSAKISNRSAYDAELLRERLENQHESYEHNLASTVKRISKKKQDYENYFRVIQGRLCRTLFLQGVYNRRNVMTCDLLSELKQRAAATKCLNSETQRLKKIADNVKSGKIDYTKTQFESISLLRVNLEDSDEEILFYVSQFIVTPMGKGEVIALTPKDEKIVIKLSFGILYANIRRAVCWRLKEMHDIAGKDSVTKKKSHFDDLILNKKWDDLKQSMTIKPDDQINIENAMNFFVQSEMKIDSEKDSLKTFKHLSSSPKHIKFSNSKDIMAVEKLTTLGNHSICDENNVETDANSDAETVNMMDSIDSSNHFNGYSQISEQFLKDDHETDRSRLVKQMKLQFVERNMMSILPLAVTPPAYLPSLIGEMTKRKVYFNDSYFCLAALKPSLTSVNEEFKDIEQKRNSLQNLQTEVRTLEDAHRRYIQQIGQIYYRCSRISQNIADVRLSLFTKRAHSRNHFNSQQSGDVNSNKNIDNKATISINEQLSLVPTSGQSNNSNIRRDGGQERVSRRRATNNDRKMEPPHQIPVNDVPTLTQNSSITKKRALRESVPTEAISARQTSSKSTDVPIVVPPASISRKRSQRNVSTPSVELKKIPKEKVTEGEFLEATSTKHSTINTEVNIPSRKKSRSRR